MELNTDHWGYRFGQPSTTAVFKQQPQDFQVIEHLGYELTGDGEHIYLNVQKTNLNTAFVAEQLTVASGDICRPQGQIRGYPAVVWHSPTGKAGL